MSKIGLAMELFGKKQSELTTEELKLYYREAKRRYLTSPEAVEKKKQRAKVWRETHKEEIRNYDRAYRKAGKTLDNDKVLKLALDLACERLTREDVYSPQATPEYYRKLARDIMRGKIETELSILPNGRLETPCD